MNYFKESASGNEKSSSSSSAGGSSSSSRKGKKGGSDKPKQPQRGLGVAQLEKIRLHGQMGYLPQEDMRIQTAYSSSSSSSFSYTSPSTASYNTFQHHQSHLVGVGELERTNVIYGECPPSSNPRWDASNAMLDAQHYAQPAGINRNAFSLELPVEDSSLKKKKKKRNSSMGSSNQHSDSNDSQELDLELRLSL